MISSTSTTDRLLTLSTAYFRSVQADFAHILSRPGLMVSATLRRQGRRLERVFQRTRRPDDRASWILFVCSMHRRYREKEGEYWEHKISSSAGDTQRLWTTFKDLLGRLRSSCTQEAPFTAEAFVDYYEAKISSIREDTAQSQEPTFPSTTPRLTVLSEINDLDLRRLILSSPPKSSELDPLPPNLIQELID